MSSTREKTHPFSVRLTTAEREELQARASGLPLGAYVKTVLFADKGSRTRKTVQGVRTGHSDLSRLLAALGASRLASNFNQIAKAAHQGALPVTKELEDELWAACAQIRDMREQLLRALGVKSTQDAVSEVFNRSASTGGFR